MNKPSFYAIIPAPVRYSTEIEPAAKLLYGEITALSDARGYCWASNTYFAELYKCSPDTISRWIKSLESAGFIRVEIDKSVGNVRHIFIAPYPQKSQEPIGKNADTLSAKMPIPYRQKCRYINKDISTDISKDEISAFAQNQNQKLLPKNQKEKTPCLQTAPPPAVPVFNPDGWTEPELAAEAVDMWLRYKAEEKRFKYKSQASFDIAVKGWRSLARANGGTLLEMVTASISNGYSGLFGYSDGRGKDKGGLNRWENDRKEFEMKQPF